MKHSPLSSLYFPLFIFLTLFFTACEKDTMSDDAFTLSNSEALKIIPDKNVDTPKPPGPGEHSCDCEYQINKFEILFQQPPANVQAEAYLYAASSFGCPLPSQPGSECPHFVVTSRDGCILSEGIQEEDCSFAFDVDGAEVWRPFNCHMAPFDDLVLELDAEWFSDDGLCSVIPVSSITGTTTVEFRVRCTDVNPPNQTPLPTDCPGSTWYSPEITMTIDHSGGNDFVETLIRLGDDGLVSTTDCGCQPFWIQ